MSEFDYWRTILSDLQKVMTVSEIAKEIGMDDDRMIWRWKAGDGRPTGLKAVRVYLLHVKRCPEIQRQFGHVERNEKTP